MQISVIIPTLNSITLPATLAAIQNQTRAADEVIVVGLDEANVTAEFNNIHFVNTERPLCAAAVRNRGMQEATGELFVFTDSDCIPNPDWLAKHEAHHADGKFVVGGGIAIDDDNYWARSDNVSMFHEFATTQSAGTRFLLPTLNLSVRREVWEKVGGMDETFPGAAGEDSDWTIRMRLAGYTLHFDPETAVRHAPARTTYRDVIKHWRNSGYNNIRVRIRHANEFKTPTFAKNPLGLRLLSPLIAARITAGIYSDQSFWRYGLSLPVVYATKIIYCWSAARSIEDGFAFE